jgi:hypothetical protein
MRPFFLVCHVLSWCKRYVQNYVFAFCACGWGLVLSTKLLARKVCFYVFMCFENEPVDKALTQEFLEEYTDFHLLRLDRAHGEVDKLCL